jgi:tripartite-type tricarboxylate transporter receptor subunit TctC
MRRRDMLAGSLAAAAILCAPRSHAQAGYPTQPIRLVVPRSAGGVVDIVARLWAEEAKQRLGSIVIENQGGGGGLIGAAAVAHAKPDGYTLLAGDERARHYSADHAKAALRSTQGSCGHHPDG